MKLNSQLIMHQTIKLLSKFFLFSLVLTFSCQEDYLPREDIQESQEVESKIKLNFLSYQQLKDDVKFSNAIKELGLINSRMQSTDRTVMEDNYGFTIDSSQVNHIEVEGITSYTMLIHRDSVSPNVYENLVVKVDSLDNTSAFIVKYTGTTTYDSMHDTYITDTEVEATEITYDISESTTSRMVYSCSEIYELRCFGGNNGCNDSGHIPGAQCYNEYYECIEFTQTGQTCGYVDDGTDDTGGHAGGDGSSGSGGGGTPPNNTDDEDTCRGCNWVPTNPVISGGNQTNPCEELGKLSTNFGTKNALYDLNQNTNQQNEKGYAVKKSDVEWYQEPEETPSSVVTVINGITSAAIPIRDYVGNDYMGFMHTHPCACYGWNPMFSAGDINSLYYIAQFHNNNGETKNYAEYFVTVAIPQGTYAIKIKDWQKFAIARNQKWGKNANDIGIAISLKEKYDERETEGDIKYYEKDILDVFKKYDMGVGLYKANDDLTEWSELVHDLNPLSPNFGFAKEKPCNVN